MKDALANVPLDPARVGHDALLTKVAVAKSVVDLDGDLKTDMADPLAVESHQDSRMLPSLRNAVFSTPRYVPLHMPFHEFDENLSSPCSRLHLRRANPVKSSSETGSGKNGDSLQWGYGLSRGRGC